MQSKKEIEALERLVETVRRLRAPDGCPWDREQTHDSLARYLIEETYEVLEAIEGQNATDLREELGDLLLQVLLHAEIAREEGAFDIGDVAEDENDKMVRRHPHVFGDASAEKTLAAWEQTKSAEKKRNTLRERLDSVPRALPSLLRAQKLLDKCEGILPVDTLVPTKLKDGILTASAVRTAPDAEGRARAAGEFFLAAVEVFRHEGIDCEAALSLACQGILEKSAEV